MNPLALVLALTAAICWGAAQVLGKLALRDLSALAFNAIRFSFVTALIFPIALLSGVLEGHGAELILLSIGAGVLGWFIGAQLFYYSLKRAPAHQIITVGNAYPFWVIVLASLFLGEGIKLILPISAALVFAGVFLLTPVQKKSGQWRGGVILASLVAFIWGATGILRKSILTGGMEPFALLTISLASAMIIFDLATLGKRSWNQQGFNRRSIGLSLASATLAFPMGGFAYLSALGMEGVSTLAPITASTILFGFLLSLILVRERPTRRAVLGMGLTFLGVSLAAF